MTLDTEFWGEVIYAYTDEQAVEDGAIVDLDALFSRQLTFNGRPVNRMTRALFADILPFLIDAKDPLAPTPTSESGMSRGYIQNLRQTFKTKLSYARDTAARGEERGVIYELPGGGAGKTIWLVRNDETGGYTVMYSSDY